MSNTTPFPPLAPLHKKILEVGDSNSRQSSSLSLSCSLSRAFNTALSLFVEKGKGFLPFYPSFLADGKKQKFLKDNNKSSKNKRAATGLFGLYPTSTKPIRPRQSLPAGFFAPFFPFLRFFAGFRRIFVIFLLASRTRSPGLYTTPTGLYRALPAPTQCPLASTMQVEQKNNLDFF